MSSNNNVSYETIRQACLKIFGPGWTTGNVPYPPDCVKGSKKEEGYEVLHIVKDVRQRLFFRLIGRGSNSHCLPYIQKGAYNDSDDPRKPLFPTGLLPIPPRFLETLRKELAQITNKAKNETDPSIKRQMLRSVSDFKTWLQGLL